MSRPDFRAQVRRRLPSLNASAAHGTEIVDDLAAQLEAAYETALADGLGEQEALQQVEAQLRQDAASWLQLDAYLRTRLAPRGLVGSGPRVSWADRVERWAGDLRQAIRHLVRDARVTVPVALTLSACIGVNAVVFTIVNTVLLRPLPFPDSDRVVLMAPQSGAGETNIRSDIPSYFDRLHALTVFDEIAMFRWIDVSLDTANGPQRVRGDIGTPSLLRLIGVAPVLGRLFHEHEGQAGAERKVIFSYELWQELYGGDPAVVGSDIRLDGRRFTVVGVMPQGFGIFRLDARLWIPSVYGAAERADVRRGSFNQYQIGRLKKGVTLDEARSELAVLDAAEMERFPELRAARQRTGYRTSVDRLQDVMTRDVRGILEFLWAGALLLLLVGVVNTTNLTIARAHHHARELATRLAIGARVSHIVRQLTAEGLLLGTLSGAGGLVLGAGILLALPRFGLTELPRSAGIQLDATSVCTTLAVGITVGLLISLAPAARLVSGTLWSTLRSHSRNRTSDRRARVVRRVLVTGQVAVAFVLISGTGLLGVSFWKLLEQKPGFVAPGVLTASFDVPSARYPESAGVQRFVTRVVEAVRTVPGVATAGVTQLLPFGGRTASNHVRPILEGGRSGDSVLAWNYVVGPGYLEAMQVPLLEGRRFDDRDTEDGLPVVIVDDVLARRLWPNGDALGQRMIRPTVIPIAQELQQMTVIGVVGAVRQMDLVSGDAPGAAYRPHTQAAERSFTLAIRADPTVTALPAVRAAVHALDPDLPLYDVNAMTDRVHRTLAPRSLALTLGTMFGATALLLATLGIYGVLTWLATQRRRELGIRLAFGSSVAGLVRLVVGEAAVLIGAGVVVGIVASAWLRELLQPHLYGVRLADPLVLAASIAAVALVSALACLAPARRVTRVAPTTVLEQE